MQSCSAKKQKNSCSTLMSSEETPGIAKKSGECEDD